MRSLFALLLVPLAASAALRPQYGGELVVTVPQPVVAPESWKAWNPAEIALARSTTVALEELVAPTIGPSGELVFDLPPQLAWADGAPVTPKSVADALQLAWKESAVAHPPLSVKVDKSSVIVTPPAFVRSRFSWDSGPWLRLHRGGAFRSGSLAADPGALDGRAFADRVRLDVREGRKLEVPENAVLLTRDAPGGRPVFALVRPGASSTPAVLAAFAGLDRAALSKLFLRGFGKVPEGWPLPAEQKIAPAAGALVIAMDESEHDLRNIAERLQVMLRDRKMQAKVVAEKRDAWFARMAAGDYDLALVPLPTAPAWHQAATLARLAKGEKGADDVWKDALKAQGAIPDADPMKPLRETAAKLGAVLLYQEGGGLVRGPRVRGVTPGNPWEIDLGSAWLAPPGAAP